MLLKDLIKEGTQIISASFPEREAREMVLAYLESVTGVRRHTHLVYPDYEIDEATAESVRAACVRMSGGEPLQYVMGKADFYGRAFNVNPDVLIPRPETELLCREAMTRTKAKVVSYDKLRILDLCTGSGCIAWTMAMECPGAEVVAVDISDGALRTASTQNFADEMSINGAKTPCFIKTDVLNPAELLEDAGSFDIILSNPPYVMDSEKKLMRANVLDHEPHLALFVPDDDALKFYKAVADIAVRLLSPSGFGIVEINEALGKETAAVFTDAGFTDVSVMKDLSDKDRFVMFTRIN